MCISWKEIGEMQIEEKETVNDEDAKAKCPDCGALVKGGTPLEDSFGVEVMTGFVCSECGRDFAE